MTDAAYTWRDLAEWEQLVGYLDSGRHDDPADVRRAQDAAENLCSAWGGWRHMPEEISNIVRRAVETGYLAALGDVREGKVNGLGAVDDS